MQIIIIIIFLQQSKTTNTVQDILQHSQISSSWQTEAQQATTEEQPDLRGTLTLEEFNLLQLELFRCLMGISASAVCFASKESFNSTYSGDNVANTDSISRCLWSRKTNHVTGFLRLT